MGRYQRRDRSMDRRDRSMDRRDRSLDRRRRRSIQSSSIQGWYVKPDALNCELFIVLVLTDRVSFVVL
jgi:hypothetical protein